MLKQITAELNFRLGRKWDDVAMLKRSARQNYYNFRAASELAYRGIPDQICTSLLMGLSSLRQSTRATQLDEDVRNFLHLALTNLEISRGQFFQDIAAWHFASQKQNGFFVEVGVGNGEDLSNTYMLEKNFGWRGILVEPAQRFHDSIAKCRSSVLDKRAAFSKDDCQLSFLEETHAGENSSLVDFRNQKRRRAGTLWQVNTVTLTTVLDQHHAPRQIDYISIDTEGSEMEILKGLDFEKYSVQFFTIEHNLNAEKKQAIVDYLQPHGYREVCPASSSIDVWLKRTGN